MVAVFTSGLVCAYGANGSSRTMMSGIDRRYTFFHFFDKKSREQTLAPAIPRLPDLYPEKVKAIGFQNQKKPSDIPRTC